MTAVLARECDRLLALVFAQTRLVPVDPFSDELPDQNAPATPIYQQDDPS